MRRFLWNIKVASLFTCQAVLKLIIFEIAENGSKIGGKTGNIASNSLLIGHSFGSIWQNKKLL